MGKVCPVTTCNIALLTETQKKRQEILKSNASEYHVRVLTALDFSNCQEIQQILIINGFLVLFGYSIPQFFIVHSVLH